MCCRGRGKVGCVGKGGRGVHISTCIKTHCLQFGVGS